MNPPHAAARPARRNRTPQRERLLELLRSTHTHPTAADLFEGLRAEFPRISLGTVYRNLEVLVCDREIEQVPSRSGVMRYDANPRPHHHFVCEACGAIRDLDIRLPRALASRLQRRYKLRAERIRADFFGLCESCIDEHVVLETGDASLRASFDSKQLEEERISAVQYVRFELGPELAARFADPAVPVTLRVDHPAYAHATRLDGEPRSSLTRDLAD